MKMNEIGLRGASLPPPFESVIEMESRFVIREDWSGNSIKLMESLVIRVVSPKSQNPSSDNKLESWIISLLI